MEQLKGIICYHTGFDEFYDVADSYFGRILIRDNKFEGVVTDYHNIKTQFIFGIFEEDRIRLYRSVNEEKEMPKLYRGEKEGKNYYGQIFATTRFAEVALGESKVTIIEPDKNCDVEYEQEPIELENKIRIMKKEMGPEATAIYQDVFWQELENEKNTQK